MLRLSETSLQYSALHMVPALPSRAPKALITTPSTTSPPISASGASSRGFAAAAGTG